jgi:hypothetical protein
VETLVKVTVERQHHWFFICHKLAIAFFVFGRYFHIDRHRINQQVHVQFWEITKRIEFVSPLITYCGFLKALQPERKDKEYSSYRRSVFLPRRKQKRYQDR